MAKSTKSMSLPTLLNHARYASKINRRFLVRIIQQQENRNEQRRFFPR